MCCFSILFFFFFFASSSSIFRFVMSRAVCDIVEINARAYVCALNMYIVHITVVAMAKRMNE